MVSLESIRGWCGYSKSGVSVVHCRAFNKRLHTRCLITVLYGAYDLIPRRNLWSALCNLSAVISNEPWLVLGDFNAVMDDSEVYRAADTSVSMTEFRTAFGIRALCSYHLLVVHLLGTIAVKGREACGSGWIECSQIQTGWMLGRIPHTLVRCQAPRIILLLFLLMYSDSKRLKGNLTDNVRQAKNFLDKAQVLFTTYKEDIFLDLVKSCRRVYSVAVKLEISMLQQRAKLRWLKHGDQSSKIFFRKINATRAKQRIFQITKGDGELVTVQQDVNQEFISYFQNLFGGPSLHRSIDLEFLRPELKHTITTAEASLLVTPVTLSEVKNAFFDIDAESAPGPDGYTSAFYRNAWPVIGQTLFQAVDEFFRTGKMLKQINTTLISLIPKVSLPRYVSDYRPIACCNVLYKSITKIIVKRLQQVLPLLIDYSQNAFVPGRSITDNILLAQELLAGYNQKRLPSRCTIKLDIQKAYDSVEWDFMLEVLKLFHFPHHFIVLINQCVSTASFSVSLNGSIHGFFKGGRGLRQGDPMSPYLFVLVMEIWNLLLKFRLKKQQISSTTGSVKILV
ncbi:UNVERIFIED_CONTAM: hypothetical protein Sradi_7206800 [Sesamum radiatum]|uniref:Reverse transcriptase domain-containing protein n=1 Tax=Sesamum radiatum TaxID=300843 RepID=A0AAW2IQT6_SESRA